LGVTDDIRRLIESLKITSASPQQINTVSAIDEMPDFDTTIREMLSEDSEFTSQQQDKKERLLKEKTSAVDADLIKEKKQTQDAVKQVKIYQAGNVATLQRMSTAQMGNIKAFAAAPFGFITRTFFKKLIKGVGILFVIEIARQVVDIILQEFFKPGRIFDTRFREEIDKQVIKFLTRKEQQELKQGFKQVITTTIGGLRGQTLAGQIGGNFFNPERIPTNFLDERRVGENNIIAQNAQERTGLQNARSRQGSNRGF
jgi:hypothetical protein